MRIMSFLVGAMFVFCGAAAQANEILVLANESMPFCGVVNEKTTGLAVDILNAVTAEGGPTFSFNFSDPWVRALVEVHYRHGSAIIPLTRTPQRDAEFKWIAELAQYNFHLITVDRPTPLTIEEAKALRIGILRGTGPIADMKAMGLINLDELTSEDMAVKMLAAGRIEVWATSDIVGQYRWAKAGQDPKRLQLGPVIGNTFHIYIAADPSFPDSEAKAIADGVERLRASGKIDAILSQYR